MIEQIWNKLKQKHKDKLFIKKGEIELIKDKNSFVMKCPAKYFKHERQIN